MNILIAGAGEIGSRYLQSMILIDVPLRIYLLSNQSYSLELCRDRWNASADESCPHQIFYHSNVLSLPNYFDLVIASSTAQNRPMIIKSIVDIAYVKYWILEKVLAQSLHGLDDIVVNTSSACNAWVNYYMSSQLLYQKIKSNFIPIGSQTIEVFGGSWGLACNALHFLHLFSWFSGELLLSLDCTQLSNIWHKSKRPDNWEIHGHLVASFTNGGKLILSSSPGAPNYSLHLSDTHIHWNIDESSGLAIRSDGLSVQCRVPHLSERTLVKDILLTGNCGLPGLTSTYEQHNMFISAMIEHWRKCSDSQSDFVPIT